MITIDDILKSVRTYNPNASEAILRKAHDFSAKAHEGQMRKSGDPYLIHPLEVAKILTQLKMDDACIVSAILHDTIEDTDVTKDDVQKEFGDEIAEIVDGVTKISKLHFMSQEDRQAENYRKLILAMSKDIRVIMVKLADRLNNMRTLQYMAEVKQVRIAQETLDIYCPIAGRMGIYWVKEELEELSLKFIKPDIFKQIKMRTEKLQKNREAFMNKVIDSLKEQFKGGVKNFEISGRLKKPYSIYRKMMGQEISLDDVHDIMAFRVLVDSIEQCYEVLGMVHTLWRPIAGRFKDYIAMPKPNNYQSLHTTVVCFEGERVEFQIRTFKMHDIAESGIAAHWKYKEDGNLDTKDEEKFRWLRQLVDWQKELTDSIEFVDTMKMDLFDDEIFVFTPKGDLKSLSARSTPVDFAYAIHSDVGHHCSGARVNGRIVPLNHRLDSGDTVEVMTNKKQLPNKDWLDFVASSKAKSHIRQFIRNQQREKSVLIGKNLFETACQRRKIKPQNVAKIELFQKMMETRRFKTLDDLYVSLAYGKYNAKDVLDDVLPKKEDDKPAKENVISQIFSKIGSRNKNLIFVDQQDGVLVTFGKCCTPVKGDPIVGFVTRGRGIVVHRTDCGRVLSADPERRVQVDWNSGADQFSLAKVMVVSEDRPGVLAEVTRVISEKNININKVLVKSEKDGISRISFDVSVKDNNELRRMMAAIENLKYVLNVIRE